MQKANSNAANLLRASVQRQNHVSCSVHCSDMRNTGANKIGTSIGKEETGRNRIQRHEVSLRPMVESEASLKADYNRLYDGYEALVKSYGELLVELSIAKDEPVRYPLTLPDRVVIDVLGNIEI